jgi:hypothetical protein
LLEQSDELRYEFRIGLVEGNGLLGCHELKAILSGKSVARTIIVVFAEEIQAVRRKIPTTRTKDSHAAEHAFAAKVFWKCRAP